MIRCFVLLPLWTWHCALADSSLDLTVERLKVLRKLRNSNQVLHDQKRIDAITGLVEEAMDEAFLGTGKKSTTRPGNYHSSKNHTYYVKAIGQNHRSLTFDMVQSIVASEWYHPGLTAKGVWCLEKCNVNGQFPLTQLLESNFDTIRAEVNAFWKSDDAWNQLKGVGAHTTPFDKRIAGNGTWVDVRLWRGRAFNKRLCERYFRTICGIVEASPEIWTNPWSHVLLSILLPNSWIPFHSGHSNGQLTYHFPVQLPAPGGQAELAVVDRAGTLEKKDDEQLLTHPEEKVHIWKLGKTTVFDDSFTHAVRFRGGNSGGGQSVTNDARVVLLLRGWHPEFEPAERQAIREFVRLGGEEKPEGYDLLPIDDSVFTNQRAVVV
eukprot:gnl/MRDRNA2_/MRDRNA2_136765_c0_seq1.p1 gnl/MRDRNA2_/MRDRNA2_136765_c0~~gnl/MRDRNA2_/MRDRNA2_136765_c0_seq1.p1  ORF type:complete len:378 (-),score=55.65 gnl/MRDRNA2_/MRDRNA2_136765_c0_seq1:23-1156(-)